MSNLPSKNAGRFHGNTTRDREKADQGQRLRRSSGSGGISSRGPPDIVPAGNRAGEGEADAGKRNDHSIAQVLVAYAC